MSLDFPWLSKYWSDHPNNSFVLYRFFQISLISVNAKNWPLAKPHRAPSRESVTNVEEGLVSFPAVVRLGLHAQARAHKMWLKHLQGGRKKKERKIARSFMHESPSVWNAFMHIIYSCSLIYPYVVKVRPDQQFQKFRKKLWERPKSLCPKSSFGHCDAARLRHVKEFPTRLK